MSTTSRSCQRRFLESFAVVLVLLAIAWLFAQPAWAAAEDPPDPLDELKELKEQYDNLRELYDDLNEMLTNSRLCQARGFSADRCNAVAAYCFIKKQVIDNLPGPGASFARSLQLFDLLSVDCGNGVCFQCCQVPGSGCHTSFVGFPVINCNANYGAGTNAAGLALVIGGEPGDACLFTPQTCEHIARCVDRSKADDAQESSESTRSKGATWLDDPRAIVQRAWVFGQSLHERWRTLLENLEASGFTRRDVFDFVTGRGCVGWRESAAQLTAEGLDTQAFGITDDAGVLLTGPTRWNALLQYGTLRLIGAYPTIDERLAAVDSRLWTDAEKQAYLEAVGGDADQAFLEHMSPIALAVLQSTTKVQDYRLLAVPLDDETPSARPLFNGCELGSAPIVTLTDAGDGAIVVSLVAGADDGGDRPVRIVWGDGTQSPHTLAEGESVLRIGHEYLEAGHYPVLAWVENHSGLSGFASTRVAVEPEDIVATPALLPTPARIGLLDMQLRTETLSGNAQEFTFQWYGRRESGDDIALGNSLSLRERFNETVDFGDALIENSEGWPLTHLVIEPYSRDGFTIGLRQRLLSIGALTLSAPNPFGEDPIVQRALEPEDLTAYDANGQAIDIDTIVHVDDNERLQITLNAVARLVIRLTEADRIALRQSPSTDPTTLPTAKTWVERRPGQFVELKDTTTPFSDDFERMD